MHLIQWQKSMRGISEITALGQPSVELTMYFFIFNVCPKKESNYYFCSSWSLGFVWPFKTQNLFTLFLILGLGSALDPKLDSKLKDNAQKFPNEIINNRSLCTKRAGKKRPVTMPLFGCQILKPILVWSAKNPTLTLSIEEWVPYFFSKIVRKCQKFLVWPNLMDKNCSKLPKVLNQT